MKRQTVPSELDFLFDTENGQLFTQTPRVIQRNKTLTPLEKDVWSALYFHGRQSDRIFPRRDTLADELGCSIRGIDKALSGLRDKGFIIWTTPDPGKRPQKRLRGQPGKANEYVLLRHPSFDQIQPEQKARPKNGQAFPKATEQSAGAFPKATEQSAGAFPKATEQSAGAFPKATEQSAVHQKKRRKKKTLNTHTDAREDEVNSSEKSVCVSDPFFSEDGKAEEKDTSEKKNGDKNQLTDLQRLYIQLAGVGKDNPAAYRAKLSRLAKRGELEVTEAEVARLRDNSFVRPNLLGDTGEPSEVQHGMDLDGEPTKVDEQDRQDQQQVRESFAAGIEYGNSLQGLCDSVFVDGCGLGMDLPVGRIKSALLVVHPGEAKQAQRKAGCVENVRQHSQGGPFGQSLLPNALRRLKALDPDLAAKVQQEQRELDRETPFERRQAEIKNLNGKIEEYTNRLHTEEDKGTVELLRRQIKMDSARLSELDSKPLGQAPD